MGVLAPDLGLAWRTGLDWAPSVLREPLALLSDHAHCELKAATTAQALIAKNTEAHDLVQRLPGVAIEEMDHFRRVHAILRDRGGSLQPQDQSPYADGLHRGSAGTRDSLLLDRLLIAHLIEARSLERFHLLASAATDPELARLYGDLLASEARHRALFQQLAHGLFDKSRVQRRLEQLAELEGHVICKLPHGPRIHSGPLA